MPMNPEIRDQWADALESGEYAQRQGVLTSVDQDGKESHCCLGVLTELAVKVGIVSRIGITDEGYVRYSDSGTGFDSMIALPPPGVTEWAGLSSNNPFVDYAGERAALAELNDNVCLDFPEIAKLIREQL